MSLWEANTNILNRGVWQKKTYKNKKDLYVSFEERIVFLRSAV